MKYSAKDHAYVYGVIAGELMDARKDYKELLEIIVKKYGSQRGGRMAQTAEFFGDPRNMQMYLAYGEWSPSPGEMDVRVASSSPYLVWNVHKCPWDEEWEKERMTELGKIYCEFVDAALVKGFSQELELETGTTQTAGDEYCYFGWKGAEMTEEKKAENKAIAEKVGKERIRSWLYHMSHMYKSAYEILKEKLEGESFKKLFENIDKRLSSHFGKELIDIMHAALLIDFNISPTGKNLSLLKQIFDK